MLKIEQVVKEDRLLRAKMTLQGSSIPDEIPIEVYAGFCGLQK